MTQKELSAKVAELKELKVFAEDIGNQIAALEDEVKAEMSAMETDELLIGAVKVTWKAYTSSRFDSKAFKTAHSDLYGQYCKTAETRRFLVA